MSHFRSDAGKKFGQIKQSKQGGNNNSGSGQQQLGGVGVGATTTAVDNTAEEAEFIQVLSGCDTSNESHGPHELRKLQSLKQFERAPGSWMHSQQRKTLQ